MITATRQQAPCPCIHCGEFDIGAATIRVITGHCWVCRSCLAQKYEEARDEGHHLRLRNTLLVAEVGRLNEELERAIKAYRTKIAYVLDMV